MQDKSSQMPSKNEETLFSLSFSIVLMEHLRVISLVLHKRHELTPSEYSTLLVLNACTQPLDSATLSQYLVFKQGTLLAILAALEERSFVQKDTDPLDERRMLISLTSAGSVISKQLSSEIAQLMRETFWRSRPTSDYLAPLQELEAYLERTRGFTMPAIPLNKNAKGLTHALLFRVIRLVVDAWTNATRLQVSLSFNEGRVLLMLEHFGELTPSDIAKRLFLARSGVSLSLARLCEQNLVVATQNHVDARSKTYRCTSLGLRLSRELFAILRKTTSDVYRNFSDVATTTLNEQHMGMYRELGSIQNTLDILLSE